MVEPNELTRMPEEIRQLGFALQAVAPEEIHLIVSRVDRRSIRLSDAAMFSPPYIPTPAMSIGAIETKYRKCWQGLRMLIRDGTTLARIKSTNSLLAALATVASVPAAEVAPGCSCRQPIKVCNQPVAPATGRGRSLLSCRRTQRSCSRR
ncbi:hypothetical protein NZK33_11410 [Cyanobium sp. FGCU-6]|nr:hypothetical protein [Cyanobium sp. FGCU6]